MSDIEDIKKRLFSVIPTSSLHMMEFLKLMDIRFVEDETVSAAVTCSIRPELLLNKTFVDTYCKTDEHLFMLVMHELYHIVLGHTHLFKRHTEIDNIAFDAVINAILCRMFPGEEYVSFFKSLNNDNSFPCCILRPIGNNTPQKFIPTLKNLYFTNTGTYFEVYECISKELEELLKSGSIPYILLGNHSDNNDDMNNPLLKKILDKIISKWPRELVVNGRDLGGELENKTIEFAKAERISKNKMKRLLRKAGVIQGTTSKRKLSIKYIQEDATLVTPDYKDRTLLTKSIIYKQPLLYNSSLISSKIVRDSNVQTLVYLDVSGSVVDDINHFAPLLLQPYKNKECLLFVFSTIVVPVSYQDFRKGKYKTTGGTSIDCIFEHYFSLPKKKQTKKILILTDGYTGTISNDYYQRIKQQKIEIYCGLFGDYTKNNISKITKYYEEF
ncbi:MAG: hypothetical protein K5765_07685 [Clostridia bacterium]|nr:hypothetical protein [Clostridia bacterium]